jgi:hypothetical protein
MDRQHTCKVCIGTQYVRPRIDYFVSDSAGPLTLIEDKLKISNDKELRAAVEQARSYALLVGLQSFIVASPEAWRLYRIDKGHEELVHTVCGPDIQNLQSVEMLRKLIIDIRR